MENKKFYIKHNYFSLFKFVIAFALLFLIFSGTKVYAENTIITIENADSTYFNHNDETGDEEVVLEGNVVVSVSSGSIKTVIKAAYITYNRSTDMIYASGGVSLEQSGSSQGSQSVTADTLLFNAITLEGVFDGGRVMQTQSDAINLPSGATLVVSSELMGRNSSGTIAFKNADLTFCDAEDPHWNIKASQIWLLPGGEFAFFNALLYVGNIPILYLPAFYYPKDELVFNPSIGYDARSGYYLQTSTYLFGRKSLNSSGTSDKSDDVGQSLYNFMKPSELKEQVQEGLVLHNLDETYKGNTTDYFKIIADYHSNLGAFAGFDFAFNPDSFISNIKSSLVFGFTNTIYPSGSYYTKYAPSGNVYFDSSNFFGLIVPFRYAGNISFSMNKPFNLSLEMPFYSDPMFSSDYGTRTETLDWIGFLMNGVNGNSSSSMTSSFTWNLNGSYNVPLADFLKPYVSSFSISNFSSSVIFTSKAVADLTQIYPDVLSADYGMWSSYTPSKYFYYPSQINPFKFSAKISGTLFSYSSSSSGKSATVSYGNELLAPDFPDANIDENNNLVLYTTKSESEDSKSNESSKKDDEDKDESLTIDLPSLTIPSELTSITSIKGSEYSLTYSLQPAFTSQISYDGTTFAVPTDFDFGDFQSVYYQVKAPLSLSSNYSYRDAFFTLKNTLNFNPVYQYHPELKGYTDASVIAGIRKNDYKADKLDLSGTNSIYIKPFIYNPVFKNSSLEWNSTVKYVRTEFTGDENNPQWEFYGLDLTDGESVTSHTLTAKISAQEYSNFSQTLTLTTSLPPQKEDYRGQLSLVFPYTNLSFSGGIKRKSSSDDWEIQNIVENLTFSIFEKPLSISQSAAFNIENNYWDSLKASVSWNGISVSYLMQNTYGYDYDSANYNWIPKAQKEFLPVNLNISYTSNFGSFSWWHNRINFTPSINSNLVVDFLQPTASYFRFVPSLTFKINEFLELSFSAETRNNVIYRYVQQFTGTDYGLNGEQNIFVDLYKSFAFWGNGCFWDPLQENRKASGFKFKSFSITLKHDLHDWDLLSTFSVKPRIVTLNNGTKAYDYSPYFTFSVSWRPMSSLKTTVVDEYGEWQLNP